MNFYQRAFIQNPFNPRTTSSPQPLPNLPQEELLTGLEILLVEDEPDIAELLTVILECAGATSSQVASAYEALDVLERYQPDLLICDVRLPDQDGDWLIRQIRARETRGDKPLPAIAVTSYTKEVYTERLLAAGKISLKSSNSGKPSVSKLVDLGVNSDTIFPNRAHGMRPSENGD